ncbi:MAG: CrcB family protein [Candidatus Nitrosocosmicus sp.]|nr:CrcB family protein [Candidatus Nitrosocosmicus sp.]MDN5867726.1 CrcB family protein [Candidatus Nitrosocosmicus sp.]
MIKELIDILFLSIGAIGGAFIRYKITSYPEIYGVMGSNVIIVNIIGSFILGAFSIISVYYNLDTKYSLFIAIGFCGSLTTMSSLALESTIMFENREILNVFINVMVNVSFSILSLVGGRILLTMLLLL